MEVDYTEGIPEKELTVYRNYMNSKIDIFQAPTGSVFRNKSGGKFYESFEHRQMQNSACKILSSPSNLIYYSYQKGYESIAKAKNELINNFTKINSEEKESDSAEQIEKKYLQFQKVVMRKKVENDPEYLKLCEFIDNPHFDALMRSNNNFLKYIMKHKYIIYHPQYDHLNQTYRKYLCPMYNSSNNEEAQQNNLYEEDI